MATEWTGGANYNIRRNAGHLVSGTVVSQAVQFAAALVLARLFSPAEFGQFASALGVATLLGVLVVFSYPLAIPLAADDEDARVLTWVSTVLAFTLSLPAFLALAALAWRGSSTLGNPIDWWYVVFVPLAAVALGIFSTMQMRLACLGQFPQIGRATASGAIVQAAAQICLGFIGHGAVGLALGYLLGRLVNIAFLLAKGRVGRPPSLRSLRIAAGSWFGTTRWLVITTVMNMMGTTAITPWVARQYGPAIAGSFALALQTLSVPAALLGQAISTILFPKLAAAKREGVLQESQLASYVTALASLAFPVFLPIFILGPQIYSVVFGDEWKVAGSIASILAPWLAVSFVSSPISSLVLVQGRFRNTTGIATADTCLRLGAIAVGGYLDSVTAGFALYSAVGVTFYGCYIAWIMRLVGGRLTALVKAGWKGCLAASLVTIVLLALRPILPFGALVVFTAMASGVGLWLSAYRVMRKRDETIKVSFQPK